MSQHEDVMLGEGGELVIPDSEGHILREVIDNLRRGRMKVYNFPNTALQEMSRSILSLEKLYKQVARGYHRNPLRPKLYRGTRGINTARVELLGEMSREVHAILYRHVEDSKQYRHDFERPTSMLAVLRNDRNDVLITSPDGSPIWQDF